MLHLSSDFYDISEYQDIQRDAIIRKEDIEIQLANLNHLVFEVTEGCNLKCEYCGYGEMYNSYDPRNNTSLTFSKAKNIIDYLTAFWTSNLNKSYDCTVNISF